MRPLGPAGAGPAATGGVCTEAGVSVCAQLAARCTVYCDSRPSGKILFVPDHPLKTAGRWKMRTERAERVWSVRAFWPQEASLGLEIELLLVAGVPEAGQGRAGAGGGPGCGAKPASPGIPTSSSARGLGAPAGPATPPGRALEVLPAPPTLTAAAEGFLPPRTDLNRRGV